ncbi:hypothetical protein OJ253_3663 [Cryptosporidium canis]|uniref:Uncharacterized protein n=1 Tax=Cryptosporidium canis TaxID=195482 RepID=A0A9D5DI88_9CRYT|nr:hypothetical protein OJ253_3663 [Cryptosporidium canis]
MSSLRDLMPDSERRGGIKSKEFLEDLGHPGDSMDGNWSAPRGPRAGTIVRCISVESKDSFRDFWDLESSSEGESGPGEPEGRLKEARLVPKMEEYLDSISRPAFSRNSSLLSIESISFGENDYKVRSKDAVFGGDLSDGDGHFSSRGGVSREDTLNDSKDILVPECGRDSSRGLLSSLSARFWNLEESLNLSRYESIRGIKTFLLGRMDQQSASMDESSSPKYKFPEPDAEEGRFFFSSSRNGYESQRSESDTSEESIRYPPVCLDNANDLNE